MLIVKKWREAKTELNDIKFKKLKVLDIISYPHCCNDVYIVNGIVNNKENKYVIKIERGTFARFDIEAKRLESIKGIPIAKIIEKGIVNDFHYIVMEFLEGDRLAELYKMKYDKFLECLYDAGRVLNKIHSLKMNDAEEAIKRKINYVPEIVDNKEYDDFSLKVIKYLEDKKIEPNNDTFIHGDYHYGNLLFKDGKLSAVLDLELSGMGFKEQDLAWALILRPPQKFFNRIYQIKEFLRGYGDNYDHEKFKWTYINGCIHFYLMNFKNERYKKDLRRLINWAMNDKF